MALSQDPLTSFFESEFRLHPVTASFSGIHGHDHVLPDWSPEGLDHAIGELTNLRAGLRAAAGATPREVPAESSWLDQVDRRLADGHVEIQIAEMRGRHFQRSNPALYTGEAVFGVIALLARSVAPLEARLEAVTARLGAIPLFLRQGRRTLQAAAIPAAWASRARRECEGAAILLSSGLDEWLAHEAARVEAAPAVEVARRAARDAAAAFDEFAGWLIRETTEAPLGCYGSGPDLFDLILERGHFCRATRTALLDAARREFQEQAARFAEAARSEATGGWPEIQARLAATHPDAGSFLRAHEEVWHACRDRAIGADLVTWPDGAPLRFEPIPPWAREAAPYLYYLLYRSPAVFDPPGVDRCAIPAIDGAPAEAREERLRASNASVIKLNHVVHHAALGHHVQNWHAARTASRVGRYAATDGASRIAMICGGTLAEGWACYATDLMAESGFLTRLELVAEEHSRLRQLARAIVDIELHQGTMGFDAAVAFYAGQVGMTEGAARAEACKNSMFPGAAIMYWLGTSLIHRLREDLRRAQEPRLSPRRFHDSLLSYGAIPVPLIAELMRQDEPASA